MALKALAFLATIFVALTLTGSARAEEFDIGGRHLTIDIMAGYCAVGHSDPADRLLYGIADEAGRGVVRTLSYQADCVALERFRKDRSFHTDVEPSLLFQITLLDGNEGPLPLTRDRFVEMMATVLKSQYSDEIYEKAKQGSQAAVTRLKEKLGDVMANIALTDTKILGVLDRDDQGVYIGIVQSFDAAGRPYVVAGVGATTLVNGLPLTITRSDVYSGPAQFPAMTAEVKRVIRELIRLNEEPI